MVDGASTVRVAGLVVAAGPAAFLTMTWYWLPFSDAVVAGVV